MSFFAALRSVLDGKLITKKEWADPRTYCLLKNERLTIFINGKDCDWIISESDMLGNDWEVIETGVQA